MTEIEKARIERDIAFYDALVDSLREREQRMETIIRQAMRSRRELQRKLDEAIAALKQTGEICAVCEHRNDCREDCRECGKECKCRFCCDGSEFL